MSSLLFSFHLLHHPRPYYTRSVERVVTIDVERGRHGDMVRRGRGFRLGYFQNGLSRLLGRMMGDTKLGSVVVVEDTEGVG